MFEVMKCGGTTWSWHIIGIKTNERGTLDKFEFLAERLSYAHQNFGENHSLKNQKKIVYINYWAMQPRKSYLVNPRDSSASSIQRCVMKKKSKVKILITSLLLHGEIASIQAEHVTINQT